MDDQATGAYQWGLIDAMAAIASGLCTPAEYLESCIARTMATEPRVGAFAWFNAEAARRASAARPTSGALAGMPIGIKDIVATRGVPTEMGSAACVGHVPDESAWVVDALASASAVMFGKTVTTEFAWRHPGRTRNPWNLDHSPGGSSSGSAAAVATGSVPAALGTQTLGSVLRPAAYCGVVGYKPSYGAIPRTGVHELAGSLDHVGTFTRNVADAGLLTTVLFGRDGIDFANTPAHRPAWPLEPDQRAPRIALLRTSLWSRTSAEQQAIVESVARVLSTSGATVREIELPARFEDLWSIARTLCDAEGSVANATLARATPPRVSQHTLDLVARGAAIPSADYIAAKHAQRALIRAFASIVEPFDAVLTAPAFGEAPHGLADTGDAAFCTPFSLMGSPAISLPAGMSANGLPLGIQLAADWGDDRRLLAIASWVEDRLDWTQGFPPV